MSKYQDQIKLEEIPMKNKEISKKLSLNKLTVSSLNETKAGVLGYSAWSCYQYSCAGHTYCPPQAC
jgi:hypothetical protein